MSKSQSGFTLVELAIVLMIIGLLIGGILKGQELINNARITSFVRNIKSYDAALLTFKDTYDALPGDMLNPQARVPNCTTAPCNVSGNSDGRLGWGSPAEPGTAWLHMAKANMISGIDVSRTIIEELPPATSWGDDALWFTSSSRPAASVGRPYTAGNWYSSYSRESEDQGAFKPRDVARIDRKMDDGKPFTGDVHGSVDSYSGSQLCTNIAETEYEEASSASCFIAIKTPF